MSQRDHKTPPEPTPESRLVLEDGSVFPGRAFGSPSATFCRRFVEAIARKGLYDLQVKSWMEYRRGAAR